MEQRSAVAARAAGKNPDRLIIDDLAPIDEFHTRGRAATEELAAALPEAPDGDVLDVGSGLGGPARFLAARRGLEVVGIDLISKYAAVAEALTRRCGLAGRARFLAGDALALPFPDACFAAACTQHVAMNIEDKAALYAGIARVLRPGGSFVLHDMLQGPGGAVTYPVPWSRDGAASFLVDPATLERLLAAAGFTVLERRDRRAESVAWFEAMAARAAASGRPPVGLHLLFGPLFAEMRQNLLVNLREERIVPTLVRAVRA
jgi:ubiquinone/menaquinone biosynthesis C-methylase UbiE